MLKRFIITMAKNRTILRLLIKKLIGSKSLNHSDDTNTKFIIISRSRTGSTMLINHLRKIPYSYIKGEIMGRKKGILFWKLIPDLLYDNYLPYKLIGFKYFYYHPIDDYDANNHIYEYLSTHPEIKIIHWLREDLFAVILSRYIAELRNAYAKSKKEKKLKDFKINEMNFKIELEKTLAQINTIRNLYSKHENYREFTYEDIVVRDKLNDIFNYLDVQGDDIVYESKTKQDTEKKYKHITNLDNLRVIYSKAMEA